MHILLPAVVLLIAIVVLLVHSELFAHKEDRTTKQENAISTLRHTLDSVLSKVGTHLVRVESIPEGICVIESIRVAPNVYRGARVAEIIVPRDSNVISMFGFSHFSKSYENSLEGIDLLLEDFLEGFVLMAVALRLEEMGTA